MDSRLIQKPETSEKLKAKQYGAAGLLFILAVIVMTVIRFVWGDIVFGSGGDRISLSQVIFIMKTSWQEGATKQPAPKAGNR